MWVFVGWASVGRFFVGGKISKQRERAENEAAKEKVSIVIFIRLWQDFLLLFFLCFVVVVVVGVHRIHFVSVMT